MYHERATVGCSCPTLEGVRDVEKLAGGGEPACQSINGGVVLPRGISDVFVEVL